MAFNEKLNDLVSSEISQAADTQDYARAAACIEALLWSVAMCIVMTTRQDAERMKKFIEEAGDCIAVSAEEWQTLFEKMAAGKTH